MKKIILLIISHFFIYFLIHSQSNFNHEEFQQYRQQIRNITTEEILQKYPAQNIYYSNRKHITPLKNFQYLDSIDLRFSLTDYEKALISDNHFMVSERLSYYSFADAFVNIYSSDLPLFLSTDFFLHALHVSYDVMLRDLEAGVLEPNLLKLLHSMRDQFSSLYSDKNNSPEMIQAIKDADLFLSIALSLLDDSEIEPLYDDSGNYPVLLDAINSGQPSVMEIGLFSTHTRKLDISQFTPRGHYTEQFWWEGKYRDLKDYFKAMMWLGRVDFMLTPPPVAPGEPEWSIDDLKRMARGAMIVNQLLDNSGKKDLFDLHEKIISFFVGPDDNLNPAELKDIMHDIALSPEELTNDLRWELFQDKLNESDDYGQKIMSNYFIVDADKENPAELPVSYRLLGQKFLIDSYVFSEVVYDRVYHEGVEVMRMMPDPLDAMFVLGNEDALALLEDELNNYQYGYKLEELRYLTDSYDPEFWSQSLYNSWLDAICELNPPADKTGFPYFMKTTEWQLEKLNTQLSSWAELRHDNVLYAKQSYTGGTSCSFPYVYIEPYPEMFRKLADFSNSAEDFFTNELESLSFFKKEQIITFWSNFADHMNKMKVLSQKELNGEAFNQDDLIYLKTFINGAMASGPSISGWYNELFYEPYKGMEADHLVVDVHTQPTDEFGNEVGKILHVGTGNINLGVFCAGSPCNNYEPAAFIGPVMSFYTKIEENWKRMNDEEWSQFFWNYSDLPDRPDWVNHYLADADGNKRGTGKERNLKGFTYMGTSVNPPRDNNDIAYLLAFPNPAKEYTSLRFVLNHPAEISVDIYDVMGRKIKELFNEKLTAGEHRKEFTLMEMSSGLYFIQLNTGLDQKTTRLVIK
jgi:hypothetical protein